MTDGITVREMLQLCPFQSLVGATGADLMEQALAAILAVPNPGQIHHDPDHIDAVRDLLRSGETVLVMAAAHADRERLLDLLGINVVDRVRTAGRA